VVLGYPAVGSSCIWICLLLIFPAVLNKVSIPDDFAQTAWEKWKRLRYSIKVLKSLSKNVLLNLRYFQLLVYLKENEQTTAIILYAFRTWCAAGRLRLVMSLTPACTLLLVNHYLKMCKSEKKIWLLHFTFNGVRGGFCIVFFVRENVLLKSRWYCIIIVI
jgi:hypothetical protein